MSDQNDGVATRPSIVQNFVVEMLSAIFLFTLPVDGLAQIRRTEAPLSVSHVCRHWRNVALSMRNLWAGIYVACTSDNSILDITTPALKEWLKRSGKTDLSIRLECQRSTPLLEVYQSATNVQRTSVSWGSFQVILVEVLKNTERLKSLSIHFPSTFYEDVLELIQKKCRSLRYLDLRVIDGVWVWRLPTLDWKAFLPIFNRLLELNIEVRARLRTNFDNFPSCPDLRKISLTLSSSEGSIKTVLKNCPSVEEVKLDLFNDISGVVPGMIIPPLTDISRVNLRNVRSLSLRTGNARFVSAVLNCILLPGLSDFNLDMGSDESPLAQDWTCVTEFLTRSNPPLENLFLKGALITPGELVQCLKLLPRLQHVRMCMTEPVARALTLPAYTSDTDELLCPALEVITIALSLLQFKDALVLWSAVEDMIRSRWSFSRDRKAPRAGLARIGSNTSASASSSNAIGQVPKTLQRVNLPTMDVKKHPLYKSVKDCIRQGFILGCDEE
ncbi:hypothetical protein DFH11DRAFT_1564950 [Phellopilus nigrolimitatus]|nr:hypothetical protein DFH11DRAFT_1564950 [Phellopilus nigrolimitatus]